MKFLLISIAIWFVLGGAFLLFWSRLPREPPPLRPDEDDLDWSDHE